MKKSVKKFIRATFTVYIKNPYYQRVYSHHVKKKKKNVFIYKVIKTRRQQLTSPKANVCVLFFSFLSFFV